MEFKPHHDYNNHQKRSHEKQNVTTSRQLCQFCGLLLVNSYSMSDHIRMLHSTKMPCICDACGKKLSSPSALREHIRSKHTAKIFTICQECGKRFNTFSLVKHLRKVHRVPKYICRFCGKKFVCGYNLKTHLRIHTGEMPYPCQDCGQMFRHRVTMKQHRLKIHNVNMFDCPKEMNVGYKVSGQGNKGDGIQ